MKILIAGAGVIGTVYGAHLAADGHRVTVAAHGSRTDTVARDGLIAHDLATGTDIRGSAAVADNLSADTYDLIMITVGRDKLDAVGRTLASVVGDPTVLVFGNNPYGRDGLPPDLPGHVWEGFPGIGGVLVDGVARYLPIRRQPTALQAGPDAAIAEVSATLRRRGLRVAGVADIDGWLAYHATFVACVASALQRCATDPRRLAADRATLSLLCRAITEGFRAQHRAGRRGLPRNLAVLHHRLMTPVAVRYWARTMRTPMGELCFAAHTRSAGAEMRQLADDVLTQIAGQPRTEAVRRLLEPLRAP